MRKVLCAIASCLALGLSVCNWTAIVAADDEWDARADQIVANFSLNDIVGQITQFSIYQVMTKDGKLNEEVIRKKDGCRILPRCLSLDGVCEGLHWDVCLECGAICSIISRIQEITMEENGGHPIIYGLDSVHGAGFAQFAVIFGHQIHGAASFNPNLVYEMGRITGRDNLVAGAPWVFSPVLEVSRHLMWPRTYETFGEDPYLVSVMGNAIIRGSQSNNHTAACMKHFIAYSNTPTGLDQDGISISDFDLLNYFVPPFKAAIETGVMTAMKTYSSVNGVPVIGNAKLLKKLLRNDLGFDGVTTSDFDELNALNSYHRLHAVPTKPPGCR
ncbi:unnamed protein product [Phytophthora lilii]|uniref:beta-glucosidase n=1 Tax=Phytophthora lilii TaxID=2077276 RepID=A0A9W6WQR2_9STRA|nr:unnamed protein product [Phytophthora lilii]